jgi:hypothetical protein
MTGKWAISASPEWSGTPPTPEALQGAAFGFRVPRQSASVHADPWVAQIRGLIF